MDPSFRRGIPEGTVARGRCFEDAAARWLEARGHRILSRNVRRGHKEVDLVVEREGVVAFVEVKTRSGTGWGEPEEAVTRRKRHEIEAVALDYLMRHARSWRGIRFDVVAIVAGPGRRIIRCDHIEDAWRPDG